MDFCELCNEKEAIRNSHIIPKFTSKWLTTTSLSGRVRYADNPSVPLEDTRKTSLLCKDCETDFSTYEGYFAKKNFEPYVKSLENRDTKFEFNYDERLEKFVVSLAWRVAQTSNKKLSPTSQVLLENYKKKCREFLFNKGTNRSRIGAILKSPGDKSLLEHLKRVKGESTPIDPDTLKKMDEADYMIISSMVSVQKGSWRILPKGIENKNKENE